MDYIFFTSTKFLCSNTWQPEMALLKYFSVKNKPAALPSKVSFLSIDELQAVNSSVQKIIKEKFASNRCRKYNHCTAEERAMLGRYAVENGPTRVSKHFSKLLRKNISEPTTRRFKEEYLLKLKELLKEKPQEKLSMANSTAVNPVEIKSLPSKHQGRPLLLGKELDQAIQEYIKNLRAVGGVVNISIVIGAARGIICARNSDLLLENGGHIQITKDWAKSLLRHMNYVKCKGSNAGKTTPSQFSELKAEFLADIQAEVVMNEVPIDLIFNWDQTGLQLVPTGQWTMNEAKAKRVMIANSDDKRQITAVFAATMTGEYLPVQLIYKGTTSRCHPKVVFPEDWDIFHSKNHWSNEVTMHRYSTYRISLFPLSTTNENY